MSASAPRFKGNYFPACGEERLPTQWGGRRAERAGWGSPPLLCGSKEITSPLAGKKRLPTRGEVGAQRRVGKSAPALRFEGNYFPACGEEALPHSWGRAPPHSWGGRRAVPGGEVRPCFAVQKELLVRGSFL